MERLNLLNYREFSRAQGIRYYRYLMLASASAMVDGDLDILDSIQDALIKLADYFNL